MLLGQQRLGWEEELVNPREASDVGRVADGEAGEPRAQGEEEREAAVRDGAVGQRALHALREVQLDRLGGGEPCAVGVLVACRDQFKKLPLAGDINQLDLTPSSKAATSGGYGLGTPPVSHSDKIKKNASDKLHTPSL